MSIGLVIPSNHLILCHPLFLLPSTFPSIRVFPNESALHIRWPKYWSFSSASVLPMNIQGLFSLGLTGLISLLSKGLLRVPYSTTIQKHHFFSAQPSLWSNSHVHTWLLECHGYMTTMVFIVFEIFQTVNYYLLQWTIISDLWCHYCKKITTWWRSWWRSAFFSSTLFLIRHVHCVFRRNAIIAHSTDYSIV